MGSAAGLYLVPADPINSASKGGVVLSTRSCALLACEGIRVNALCLEFVNTDAIYEKNLLDVKMVGGFLPMETVVQEISSFWPYCALTYRRPIQHYCIDNETRRSSESQINERGRFCKSGKLCFGLWLWGTSETKFS